MQIANVLTMDEARRIASNIENAPRLQRAICRSRHRRRDDTEVSRNRKSPICSACKSARSLNMKSVQTPPRPQCCRSGWSRISVCACRVRIDWLITGKGRMQARREDDLT